MRFLEFDLNDISRRNLVITNADNQHLRKRKILNQRTTWVEKEKLMKFVALVVMKLANHASTAGFKLPSVAEAQYFVDQMINVETSTKSETHYCASDANDQTNASAYGIAQITRTFHQDVTMPKHRAAIMQKFGLDLRDSANHSDNTFGIFPHATLASNPFASIAAILVWYHVCYTRFHRRFGYPMPWQAGYLFHLSQKAFDKLIASKRGTKLALLVDPRDAAGNPAAMRKLDFIV